MQDQVTTAFDSPQKDTLVPAHAWIRIVVIGALFVLLHSYVLKLLYQSGRHDPDWAHIFLIPFISIYLIYHQRERLRNIPIWRDWIGIPIFVGGFTMYAAGIHLHSTMVMGYAMIIELLGITWYFVGRKMMTVLWVPILYLGFGVKFSVIYTYISLILQHVASAIGSVLINITGLFAAIEAEPIGAMINIYHRGALMTPPLNVEEACSGLRSLMALGALSVAMAFLNPRPWQSRILVIAAAVPVAVTVNAIRIAIIGLMYPYMPQLSRGDPHEFLGLVMLVPALLALTGIMRLTDHIFANKN